MERISLPSSPEEARVLFLEKLKAPIIIDVPNGTWPHSQLGSPSDLATQCGDVSTSFRVWSRTQETEVVWENECEYIDGSFREFNDWLCSEKAGSADLDDDNPFSPYRMEEVCVYAAYKSMVGTFGEDSSLCQSMKWDMFGFPERSAVQTTFWCGSEGAYTPCHYDTYGFNIVVQLYGRKRWTLFSPDQTPFLYCTRLPYEESSVFSEVNINYPDTERHPLFKQTKPVKVC